MPTSTTKHTDTAIWDVVVIGGGPSGMMAASSAAAAGAQVLLLEKNDVLGKKLSTTGGGRCNITNNKPVVRDMLSQYKTAGKFLFTTFMQHGVAESIDWFAKRNVPFVEENEGRLFPATLQAQTVTDTMVAELSRVGVAVRSQQAVTGITKDVVTRLFAIVTKTEVIQAHACIVATGGTARPETGSTGDGFGWLKQLGHTVEANSNALVPLTLKSSWTKKLSGLTFPEVKITIWADEKKHSVHTGKLLFTHVGLTGPTILNLSKTVGDLLQQGEVVLKLDVLPKIAPGELKELLQSAFVQAPNKKIQNVLSEYLPLQFVKGVLAELAIDGELPAQRVSRSQRMQLISYLKVIPLAVQGLLGADKAVVSAGGVVLEEVDFKTMESKLVPDLYIVGDVLNINRPSGGYGLQLCWSTGVVAGQAAAASSKSSC